MTQAETAKLITVITAAYPTHFANYTTDKLRNLVAAWSMVMEDYRYEEASAGLKVFMASESKGFPPSPGQVIDCIHQIKSSGEEMNALIAWQYVVKAIRNSNYHAEEEFEKLPPLAQKAVGTPDTLREWAQMDSDVVHSVEQSHFIRAYDTTVKREKDNAKIPERIRAMIADANGGLIEEHN